jgi:glycosyltransferase involved in cell wall biosynthesis
MNILLAMPWDQRTGGVTHVAASLAGSLEKRGHRVLFLFPGDIGFAISSRTSLRGFPSVYCRLRDFPPEHPTWRARFSWYSTVLTTLPQLVRLGRSRNINLVNVHYPVDGSALLVDLARWLRAPLVVSAHGSDLLPDTGPNRGRGLLRQLENADAVVAPSQNYLRSVSDAFPELRDKIRCIHNGYDEGELAAAPPTHSPDVEVTGLCVAALIPKKGIDVLLQAIHRCKSARLRMRIIGEGPLRTTLESLSTSLSLADRVYFIGSKNRDEVMREIARCDFLVMASRHPSESFGLAALEAMANGKPVVASAIGGLQELVDDRQTGLLVPPEDVVALAEALDFLASDPALRATLGAGGRSKARNFTVRATADAYESLFSNLLNRGNLRTQVAR